jgi:hypothetical protein
MSSGSSKDFASIRAQPTYYDYIPPGGRFHSEIAKRSHMQLPVLRRFVSAIESTHVGNGAAPGLTGVIASSVGCLVAASSFYSMPLAADEGGVVWLHCNASENSQIVGIDAANKLVIIYSSSGTHTVDSVFRDKTVTWSDDNDVFHGFINRQTLAYRFTVGPVRNPNAGGEGKCQKVDGPAADAAR